MSRKRNIYLFIIVAVLIWLLYSFFTYDASINQPNGGRVKVSPEAMKAAIEKRKAEKEPSIIDEIRDKQCKLMTAHLWENGIDAVVRPSGSTMVIEGDMFNRPTVYNMMKGGMVEMAKVGEFKRISFRGKNGTFDFDTE